MKKNGNQKPSLNGQKSRRIRVEFTDPTATAVAIAGSFNEWHPDATPMIAFGQGRWATELALPPGTYSGVRGMPYRRAPAA